ncbi:hypothetical protein FRB98_005322 [Tulasnella sp. 332]|nr:hypothetical protein FRB98_005322 [Tulasnella sp. 332]
MKDFQCAVCLESHSPTTRKFAIHCGHVFCEPCITGFVASKRVQNQPIICPSCRAPFVDRPPLLIELFLEYADEDQPIASGSGSNGAAISERDKQQMTDILEEIDNLGVESSGKDLEGVIAKGETLSLRLHDTISDDATKTTLKSIMTTLESLRGRLVYAQRLASLKSVNERVIAEHDTTKASLVAVTLKYRNMKKSMKDSHEALRRALEREAELTETKRSEGEKVLKQLVSVNVARDSAVRELAEVKKMLEEEEKASLKWQKKYLAAKRDLKFKPKEKERSAAISNNRPIVIEDTDEDDTLEIISQPSPPESKAKGTTVNRSALVPSNAGATNDKDVEMTVLKSTQPVNGPAKRKAQAGTDDENDESIEFSWVKGGNYSQRKTPAVVARNSVYDLTNSDDLEMMGAAPSQLKKTVGKRNLTRNLRTLRSESLLLQ